MQTSLRLLLSFALLAPAAHAQTQPLTTPQAASAPTQPETTAQKPSDLVAPAVDHLSQTVSQIQLEKWKGSSRDETDSNLRSIERDISNTLPPLVTAADGQPNSLVLTLPVLRNLDALCAVLIRVSVTARSNAPAPQADALADALLTLQNARNALSTQADTIALAQQVQLNQLKAAAAALNAKPVATPPAPPAPASSKAKPRRVKKVTKAAVTAASGATAHPSSTSASKPNAANTNKPAQP